MTEDPSDLRAQIEELRILLRRNETRSQEFISRLAHELRGPLGVILMWGHVLRTGNENDRVAALDAIDASTRAQSAMIGTLLDVSRGVTGRLKIGALPLDLRDPFTRAVEAAAPLARDRKVEFDVSTDDGDFPAHGDAMRLRQAIGSLLDNAIKFTPTGGRVGAQLIRGGGGAVALVVVTDTGSGFASDELADAFAPFSVVGSGNGRPVGGLGLSLALVRLIAELHQGSVGLKSEGKGLGSTFELRIPLTTAPPA